MSGSSSRFVEIPADALLAELRSIGDSVVARGGKFEESSDGHGRRRGHELVYEIVPPARKTCIRVFTSLSRGADAVRGCGEDAVRIVVGGRVPTETTASVFRSIDKPRRIYRTAPAGADEARVAAFLGRLRQALRDAYAVALKAPTCPLCQTPMARRKTKIDPTRSIEVRRPLEFYGCIRFPECRGTRPMEEK